MDYTDLELKIHSALADAAKAPIKLWYMLRAIDIKGSGQVVFSINAAATALAVTRRTIKNYLATAPKYMFRQVQKLDKDTYRVYYGSAVRVAVNTGCTTFGSVAYATTKELVRLRVSATEITAQAAQAASKFKAYLEQKNFAGAGTARRPLNPETLFDNLDQAVVDPSSSLCKGALGFNHAHRTLFVNQGFIAYGASQQLTADRLKRSKATVQRRLKDTERVRLAQYHQNNYVEQALLKEDYDPEAGRFIKVNSPLICNNPEAQGKTFKLLCNVYYPCYQTTSFKQGRHKLSLALAKRDLVDGGII
jgi:hypothetical protein